MFFTLGFMSCTLCLALCILCVILFTSPLMLFTLGFVSCILRLISLPRVLLVVKTAGFLRNAAFYYKFMPPCRKRAFFY